jgi:hypothetical protein
MPLFTAERTSLPVDDCAGEGQFPHVCRRSDLRVLLRVRSARDANLRFELDQIEGAKDCRGDHHRQNGLAVFRPESADTSPPSAADRRGGAWQLDKGWGRPPSLGMARAKRTNLPFSTMLVVCTQARHQAVRVSVGGYRLVRRYNEVDCYGQTHFCNVVAVCDTNKIEVSPGKCCAARGFFGPVRTPGLGRSQSGLVALDSRSRRDPTG